MDAPMYPWMIVEVKPHSSLPAGQLIGNDPFSELSREKAATTMLQTSKQVLEQVEAAFDEYPSRKRLVVLMAVGPFFEFFKVIKPFNFKKSKDRYILTPFEEEEEFDNTTCINPKWLFTGDGSAINPQFDEFWGLALREHRL